MTRAAMILAAGRGERLRPLTDRLPKPLVEAGGETLIGRHVRCLASAGYGRLVINTAHLGHLIEKALGDGRGWGVDIVYSREDGTALDTGGGILNALELMGGGPFPVVNGDIWTDYPFERMALAPADLAHLVLVPNPDHNTAGDFALAAGRVTDWVSGEAPGALTFSGIGIYHPDLFQGCEPGIFPLAPLLRDAAARGRVSGECYAGAWTDVGTVARLEELRRRVG
ncbi:MAG: nucleotidyltransferase family protein [Gammaproteobacteria bacterium]|nr:nucleotidyltransferase family protein [Gammaproteobacteria bacterium]